MANAAPIGFARFEALTDAFDFSEIVPDCYEGFRPAVRDALLFFVGQLQPERVFGILRHQADLPVDCDTRSRMITLMRDCPSLQKLGQVVARHPNLDPAFSSRLQELEMFDSPLAPAAIEKFAREKLGDDFEAYGITLIPDEAIEASVALVVPCRWHRRGRKRMHDAVLKIIKPGLKEVLEEELDILDGLADFFDERQETYHIPRLPYRETFKSVRTLLEEELRLTHEQRHLVEAHRFYGKFPAVQVPEKLPFSTPDVTAMERVWGVRVTELTRKSGETPKMERARRRALAETITQRLITDVIFSRDPVTVFHADPHAGNLFATDDGRLALLDWSLTGRLSKSDREHLADIFIGGLSVNGGRIRKAVKRLAIMIDDDARLDGVIKNALEALRTERIPGPGWFTDFLEELATNGVHFPPSLVLFRKSMFTLKGVIAHIDPEFQMGVTFLTSATKKLVQEWPRRMTAMPFNRDYSTHVSNFDLWRLYFQWPVIALRYARITMPRLRPGLAREKR